MPLKLRLPALKVVGKGNRDVDTKTDKDAERTTSMLCSPLPHQLARVQRLTIQAVPRRLSRCMGYLEHYNRMCSVSSSAPHEW